MDRLHSVVIRDFRECERKVTYAGGKHQSHLIPSHFGYFNVQRHSW